MASALHKYLFFLYFLFISSSSFATAFTPYATHLQVIRNVCKTTPYPDSCFDSLKLPIPVDINTPLKMASFISQALQIAISEGNKLLGLLGNSDLVEKQRGSVEDCKELHQITLSVLEESISGIGDVYGDARKLADFRSFLSAAVTNRVTCLEGLNSAAGEGKSTVVESLDTTYAHVSNSLSMLSTVDLKRGRQNRRRLLGFPRWVSRNARRILIGSGEEYDHSSLVIVAADGTGNFTTVSEAVDSAPSNSVDRVIIYVKQGIYEENVEIPSWKTNIVLIGDGRNATVITGNRSVASGWTTFRSATVGVSGEGFLARDIKFENTAGPENHQAVALRINADFAAVYRCAIVGYQDTLYAHSFRQFYRECDIFGTIDYIFGNAAVVFQDCNIISRMPISNQFTVITAQGRDSPDENTGISLQNCTILATDDLNSNSSTVNSYLGRPWRNYSTTVVMESYINGFIAAEGWTKGSGDGDQGLDTLYFGEYHNSGPGSAVNGRVSWSGFHLMEYYEAANFTVSEFISSEDWLDSTAIPYDDNV